MPLDATANFVRGETDSSTDSTQTTVSVVDASILPDPATEGEYNVVIWDVTQYPRPDQDPNVEILRVTAIDTTADDLTVTRGQEGTSGASHPLGSAVHLSPTAKMFGDIEATFNAFYDDANDVLTSQVGTSTNRSDIFGDAADLNSVSTENITSKYHFAAAYDGADNDARLDNALSAASDGDVIYLETAEYGGRTVTKRVHFVGGDASNPAGAYLTGTWTVDDVVTFTRISADRNLSMTINQIQCRWRNSVLEGVASVTVAADEFSFVGCRGGTITFQSGTSTGIVDACMATSVTDNGTNTVGDIA